MMRLFLVLVRRLSFRLEACFFRIALLGAALSSSATEMLYVLDDPHVAFSFFTFLKERFVPLIDQSPIAGKQHIAQLMREADKQGEGFTPHAATLCSIYKDFFKSQDLLPHSHLPKEMTVGLIITELLHAAVIDVMISKALVNLYLAAHSPEDRAAMHGYWTSHPEKHTEHLLESVVTLQYLARNRPWLVNDNEHTQELISWEEKATEYGDVISDFATYLQQGTFLPHRPPDQETKIIIALMAFSVFTATLRHSPYEARQAPGYKSPLEKVLKELKDRSIGDQQPPVFMKQPTVEKSQACVHWRQKERRRRKSSSHATIFLIALVCLLLIYRWENSPEEEEETSPRPTPLQPSLEEAFGQAPSSPAKPQDPKSPFPPPDAGKPFF